MDIRLDRVICYTFLKGKGTDEINVNNEMNCCVTCIDFYICYVLLATIQSTVASYHGYDTQTGLLPDPKV